MKRAGKLYGLIGYPLSHSRSPHLFEQLFEREGMSDSRYQLFPLKDLSGFSGWLRKHPRLLGLNVTIPHKQSMLPFLHHLDETAESVGAVNTITIDRSGSQPVLCGYNTDVIGFARCLEEWDIQGHHALILGTGGAAQAVRYTLSCRGWKTTLVSRESGRAACLSYDDLNPDRMREHQLLVNATPLGMYPHANTAPPLPYECLESTQVLIDLVYNPPVTRFVQHGRDAGCICYNGLSMLQWQAEASLNIWLKQKKQTDACSAQK